MPPARTLGTGLALAALVLWAFTGWTWWVLLPVIGGLIIIRLALPLFPPAWRGWAGAALALIVVLFLITQVSARATGIAVGVVALAVAFGLRAARPTWARWVALGVGAALVVGCALAELVVWVNTKQQREAAEQMDREFRIAQMRPGPGLAALHQLARAVAENNTGHGCWLFSDAGRAEFAAALGVADCPAAITKLHGQVTNPAYGGATAPFDDITYANSDGVAGVAGCRMYIHRAGFDTAAAPGPKLGQLRLEKDPRFPTGGYLITGYTPCGQTRPGTPPSTPTRPPVLPSYPPQFAGLLAGAVADRDPEVCGYFTPTGVEQFAAAFGVGSCPDAVATLAARVIDPDSYRNPSGATHATTPAGVVVDACRLTWTRFGAPDAAPSGPQLGHLTLQPGQAGKPGYLIGGYRPC